MLSEDFLVFELEMAFCFVIPDGSDGKASACSAGDPGSIPGLGISPGEGKWQPTPVLLPGESREGPGRLQSMGSQRVGHD